VVVISENRPLDEGEEKNSLREGFGETYFVHRV
jgi:hypothetical protein